jgi:hypothetical protein
MYKGKISLLRLKYERRSDGAYVMIEGWLNANHNVHLHTNAAIIDTTNSLLRLNDCKITAAAAAASASSSQHTVVSQ